MKPSRYAVSRQKSCHPCASAKARCDRKAGSCDRCMQKGLQCVFPGLESSPSSTVEDHISNQEWSQITLVDQGGHVAPSTVGTASIGDTHKLSQAAALDDQHFMRDRWPTTTGRPATDSDVFDFANLDLECTINVDHIKERWMSPFVPFPGQTIKELPERVILLMSRILKSFAAMMVHGRGLPSFIHPLQMMSKGARKTLSTCASVVRMCDMPLPGSEDHAVNTLQREMITLFERREHCDDMQLLAVFQSYLVYSMVLHFWLGSGLDRLTMINLQELACASAKQGLVSTAEQQGTRPRWETWLMAEAKRRTLYTMYLFDNVLSVHENLPTNLGTELRGLLTPGSKTLWQAQTRHKWEAEYNIHLATWPNGGLTIDELWAMTDDLDQVQIYERRRRIDRWLEDLDEFGTMLYAVTCYIHGV